MKKTRRRYVLSPRGAAALLPNLKKAWSAPKNLVYRPTVRRLRASYASLIKALAAKQGRLADDEDTMEPPVVSGATGKDA